MAAGVAVGIMSEPTSAKGMVREMPIVTTVLLALFYYADMRANHNSYFVPSYWFHPNSPSDCSKAGYGAVRVRRLTYRSSLEHGEHVHVVARQRNEHVESADEPRATRGRQFEALKAEYVEQRDNRAEKDDAKEASKAVGSAFCPVQACLSLLLPRLQGRSSGIQSK